MPKPGYLAALAMLAFAGDGPVDAASPVQGTPLPAAVEGTSLVVVAADGRRVTGRALVGAIVVGSDPASVEDAFRIDAVGVDPDDAEIVLYTLSSRNPRTGAWRPHCVPDARGVAGAFFLSGSWDDSGTHRRDDRFSVTCTSGAIGKCVRYGYKPWKTAADGRSMWDYHQACTRLVRADYCGNGLTHTREGVQIEILSRFAPEEEPGTDLVPEAAWDAGGATCVARPRLTTWSLDRIEAECPERLRGRTGEASGCGPSELFKQEILLVNKSRANTR